MTAPYATPEGNVVAEQQLNKSFDTLGEKPFPLEGEGSISDILPPMSQYSYDSDLFNNLPNNTDNNNLDLPNDFDFDFDLSFLDDV